MFLLTNLSSSAETWECEKKTRSAHSAFLLPRFLCFCCVLAAWYSIPPLLPPRGTQGRSPITDPLSSTRSRGVKGRECCCWSWGCIKASEERGWVTWCTSHLSGGWPNGSGSWCAESWDRPSCPPGHVAKEGTKCQMAAGGQVIYCGFSFARTTLVNVTLAHPVPSLRLSGGWSVCWLSRSG